MTALALPAPPRATTDPLKLCRCGDCRARLTEVYLYDDRALCGECWDRRVNGPVRVGVIRSEMP